TPYVSSVRVVVQLWPLGGHAKFSAYACLPAVTSSEASGLNAILASVPEVKDGQSSVWIAVSQTRTRPELPMLARSVPSRLNVNMTKPDRTPNGGRRSSPFVAFQRNTPAPVFPASQRPPGS